MALLKDGTRVYGTMYANAAVSVGTSTSNAVVNTTIIQISNSTAVANITPVGIVAGVLTANTTQLSLSTNFVANTTTTVSPLFTTSTAATNATVNTTALSVKTSTSNVTITSSAITVGANVSLNTAGTLQMGNLTSNATLSPTSFSVGGNGAFLGAVATFNANTGVNGTTEFITTTAAHGLATGDYVRYITATGNTALTGLTNGSYYYITNANTTAFTLSTSFAGANVDITPTTVSETGHLIIPQRVVVDTSTGYVKTPAVYVGNSVSIDYDSSGRSRIGFRPGSATPAWIYFNTGGAQTLTFGTSPGAPQGTHMYMGGQKLGVGNFSYTDFSTGTMFMVGNSTASAINFVVDDAGTVTIGNTTVNSTANSTLYRVGNTTVNAVVNSTSATFSGTNSGLLSVGNSTVNSTLSETTLTVRDATISGNLTVSGTTTYINTTNLNVGDNIITLNADVTGATTPSENAGIEVNRGNLTNTSFYWDETNDRWTAGNTALANTTITGFINVSSTANIGDVLTARANVTVNGALVVANTAALGNTTVTGFANVSSTLQVGSDTTLNGNLAIKTIQLASVSSTGTAYNLSQGTAWGTGNIKTHPSNANVILATETASWNATALAAFAALGPGATSITISIEGSYSAASIGVYSVSKAANVYTITFLDSVNQGLTNWNVQQMIFTTAVSTLTVNTGASATSVTVGNSTVNTSIASATQLVLGGRVTANGANGTAGQVLTSGAAGNVYWSTVSGGGSLPTTISLQNTTATATGSGANSIAIGANAQSTANISIAIGANTMANGTSDAVAIGYNSVAGNGSIVIGSNNATTASGFGYAILIGRNIAGSVHNSAIAIGNTVSILGGPDGIGIGNGTKAGQNAVAIGGTANAGGTSVIAIGYNAQAQATGSLAIGYNANVTGTNAHSFGAGSTVTGNNSFALGPNNIVTGQYAGAIGKDITNSTSNTIIIGTSAQSVIVGLFTANGAATVNGAFTANGSATVNGSLIAVTKSFDIAHPSVPGKRLRYGSLEGPENGVYVRGRANTNIIELPSYWKDLVHDDSITVELTSIGKYQKLYVVQANSSVVEIAQDNIWSSKIDCYFTVYGERKDVAKITVEY